MPKVTKRGKTAKEIGKQQTAENVIEKTEENINGLGIVDLNVTYNVLALKVDQKLDKQRKVKGKPKNEETKIVNGDENGTSNDVEGEACVSTANEKKVSPKRSGRTKATEEPSSKKGRNVEKANEAKPKARGKKKASSMEEDIEPDVKDNNGINEDISNKNDKEEETAASQNAEKANEAKSKRRGIKKAPPMKQDNESDVEDNGLNEEVANENGTEEETVVKPKRGRKPKAAGASKLVTKKTGQKAKEVAVKSSTRKTAKN